MSGDRYILYFLFLLFFFIGSTENPIFAQTSKEKLKQQKQRKLERIKEVEKIISETSGQKKNTLGELNALNQRISIQQSLISSIRSEVGYLDNEIDDTNEIIESLEGDLERLKDEYASMVYAASKANQGINKITFLFSANSFTQLRARLRYMEQYSEARQNQADQIIKVKDVLEMQIVSIQQQKEEKDELLQEQINENTSLRKLKNKRSSVLNALVQEEDKLRSELEKSKKAVAEIDSRIRAIIAEELARAAKDNSIDYSKLSNSFENNKRKFPWPVNTGFVSQHFGRQQHAALEGVVVENPGIYIQTQQKEQIKVIFDGDVRFVRFIPGMGFTVLVKHGDYYTVYGGLQNPSIKAGDKIKAGDSLGEVITKAEGVTELYFEIRRGRSALDPEQWLAKNN